jgi:2,4-dienoyl-CoA reductase-like NADH-dependent reductase (Old Yellow Enzyme family)
LEKRLVFPLAVVDEVKRVAAEHADGKFLIGYRFSPEEETEPGLTMKETFRLLDALSDKELDYLHVSLNDFRSKPRRGADESRTRLEWIQERVGAQVPVIGVGAVLTPEDAVEAAQTGVPLVAIGRELIMEPDWVEKVASGKQSTLRTTIQRTDQEKLVVPTPLWQAIVHSPGWFPVGD